MRFYDVGLNCTLPSFSSTSLARVWTHGGAGPISGEDSCVFFVRVDLVLAAGAAPCGPASWFNIFDLLGMQPMVYLYMRSYVI